MYVNPSRPRFKTVRVDSSRNVKTVLAPRAFGPRPPLPPLSYVLTLRKNLNAARRSALESYRYVFGFPRKPAATCWYVYESASCGVQGAGAHGERAGSMNSKLTRDELLMVRRVCASGRLLAAKASKTG